MPSMLVNGVRVRYGRLVLSVSPHPPIDASMKQKLPMSVPEKTWRTQRRPGVHSLSASQESQAPNWPTRCIVHVPSERRQLFTPQRAASVSPVHCTQTPRSSSHTGVAPKRVQSVSAVQDAQLLVPKSQRAAVLGQSVFISH